MREVTPKRAHELAVERATREACHEAWIELLARWPWAWFATLTFRPDWSRGVRTRLGSRTTGRLPASWWRAPGDPLDGASPEGATKAFRRWASELNRATIGPNWHRGLEPRGCSWALAQEPHRSGRVHLHALLVVPPGRLLRHPRGRLAWMDRWDELAGFARILEPVTARGDELVRAYVTKYVAKGGAVDLGGPEPHQVAASWRAAGRRRRALRGAQGAPWGLPAGASRIPARELARPLRGL